MSVTLKLRYGSEVHRILLQEHNVTYQVVQEAIQGVHGSAAVAKYVDEDNDLCTLCLASFSDFLTYANTVRGRRILKLEVTIREGSTARRSQAHSVISAVDGYFDRREHVLPKPIADLITQGFPMIDDCAKSAALEAVKKVAATVDMLGFDIGCSERGNDAQLGNLAVIVLQLRKNGLLNKNTAAALCLHLLPEVLSHVAAYSDEIDWVMRAQMNNVRPLIQQLRDVAAQFPDLENCVVGFDNLLSAEGHPPTEALLALLTSLDNMPFDRQVAFIEAVYTSQSERLEELLRKTEAWTQWIPTVSLDHVGVVCDGCNIPIQGLRFKCKTCLDYDLCAECYTDRTNVHTEDKLGHGFELKCFSVAKGCCWGKGGQSGQGLRAREGELGAQGNPCEADSQNTCAKEGIRQPHFRFPVMVEDGRRLTIEWNRSDDSQTTAHHFATTHAIPVDEIPTIVNFIEHVMTLHAPVSGQGANTLPMQDPESSPTGVQLQPTDDEELHKAIHQLVNMGVGTAEVLNEFMKDSGGDVQKVIALLTSDE